MGVQNRNRPRSCKKKIFCCITTSFILLILLHPNLNARNSYNFIEKDLILVNLHKEIAKNFNSSAALFCQYQDIIFDETSLSMHEVVDGDTVKGHSIREGGEYYPLDCKPKFSVAVIVPYRDQPNLPKDTKSPAEQLRNFLVYMHTFLSKQRIHYKIFIVEQISPHSAFNRGKLWNVGAKAAIEAGFPCLILHDVDLLPIKVANIYTCTELPRHMSPCISTMRFVLPHLRVFNGPKSILSKQYLEINGMSNTYDSGENCGWDAADSDLYFRLDAHNLTPCRFDSQISQYYDISQRQLKRTNWIEPSQSTKTEIDGLSTLRYSEVVTVKHPLFTHIVVEFALGVSQGLNQPREI